MKKKELEYKLVLKADGYMDYSSIDNIVLIENKKRFEFYNTLSYERIYSISNDKDEIMDIKLEDHKNVLIIYRPENNIIRYSIFNIESKKQSKIMSIKIGVNKSIEMLELINDRIVYGIKDENVMIFDYMNNVVKELKDSNNVNRYMILNRSYNNVILLCNKDRILLYDLNGVKHKEIMLILLSMKVMLNNDKLLIYSVNNDNNNNCIMIYDSINLELLYKIIGENEKERMILSNINSLSYDDRNNNIILGDKMGNIHIWSI